MVNRKITSKVRVEIYARYLAYAHKICDDNDQSSQQVMKSAVKLADELMEHFDERFEWSPNTDGWFDLR